MERLHENKSIPLSPAPRHKTFYHINNRNTGLGCTLFLLNPNTLQSSTTGESPGGLMSQQHHTTSQSQTALPPALLGPHTSSINTARIATCWIMAEQTNQREVKMCLAVSWMLSNLSPRALTCAMFISIIITIPLWYAVSGRSPHTCLRFIAFNHISIL